MNLYNNTFWAQQNLEVEIRDGAMPAASTSLELPTSTNLPGNMLLPWLQFVHTKNPGKRLTHELIWNSYLAISNLAWGHLDFFTMITFSLHDWLFLCYLRKTRANLDKYCLYPKRYALMFLYNQIVGSAMRIFFISGHSV